MAAGVNEAAAVARAIAALRAGAAVLLPTDTVYGLCADAGSETAARAAYALKGRSGAQPTALLAAGVEQLLECLPELPGDAARVCRALLPGPFTLVLPNPAHRYRWLTGSRPETIGVRVAALPPSAQAVLDAVGCVLATSANDPGDAAPATLDAIPVRLRAACGAELDVGPLPGTASTVVDVSGDEPVVLRAGLVPAGEALARVAAALVS